MPELCPSQLLGKEHRGSGGLAGSGPGSSPAVVATLATAWSALLWCEPLRERGVWPGRQVQRSNPECLEYEVLLEVLHLCKNTQFQMIIGEIACVIYSMWTGTI